MNLRPTPRVATWFLNQFGPATEEESELGDLVEQYQRGHGPIWYWRQVLAIVYGELYQQFRNHKRQFIGALVRTWCVAGVLHFAAGVLLVLQHRFFHPYQYAGLTACGFPLLTLRIGKGLWRNGSYSDQWDISLTLVALNVFLPLLIGRLMAASSDINPRTLFLAYTTSFTIANFIWTAESIRMFLANHPSASGFLISSLIALPLVPALLFLGMRGHRGQSAVSPQIKGVKA